jgi:hypothetical protein
MGKEKFGPTRRGMYCLVLSIACVLFWLALLVMPIIYH